MCRKLRGISARVGRLILLLGGWTFADSETKKVGLMYSTGGRGDLSFCDASYAGVPMAFEQGKFTSKRLCPVKVPILNMY